VGIRGADQLTDVDAKFQALSREMQLPAESMLTMLRVQAGIQEEFEPEGTIVVLLLPPDKRLQPAVAHFDSRHRLCQVSSPVETGKHYG
jgi:hypothetical protein